jgi:hypothetical protein
MVHEAEVYVTIYQKNVFDFHKFICKVNEISPKFRAKFYWYLCVLKDSEEQESSQFFEYSLSALRGDNHICFSFHEANFNRIDIFRESINFNKNHKSNIILIDEDCGMNPIELIKLLIEFEENNFDLMGTQHQSFSHSNYAYQNSNYMQVIEREWVEIGPILILKWRKFAQIFPFFFKGMGYGLEFYWKHLSHREILKIGLSTCKIIHRRETRKIEELHYKDIQKINTSAKIADL